MNFKAKIPGLLSIAGAYISGDTITLKKVQKIITPTDIMEMVPMFNKLHNSLLGKILERRNTTGDKNLQVVFRSFLEPSCIVIQLMDLSKGNPTQIFATMRLNEALLKDIAASYQSANDWNELIELIAQKIYATQAQAQ